MSTNYVPREPFLSEPSFNWNDAYTRETRLQKLRHDTEDASLHPADQIEANWRLGSEMLHYTATLYSGGKPVAGISPQIRAAIDSYEIFAGYCAGGTDTPQLDFSIQTYFVDAVWLLSLTVLLGLGDKHVERVANIFSADPSNDGADELLELILAKLGRKSFEAEGVIHEDPYQLLLDCVKAEPDNRPALMTKFLKRWFKGQKDCDWWGSHIPRKGTTVLDTGFFGYWAFEAALVTVLWDIDDSSYRELPHYPKDLADYARQNAQTPTGAMPVRVEAGQPCPRTGYWSTPARADSRRHFEQGEPMPDIGGDYGATIWQWDERQA